MAKLTLGLGLCAKQRQRQLCLSTVVAAS
jgi:hypothetical protein